MHLKRALPLFAGVALTMGALAPVATAQFVSDEIVREVVTPIDVSFGVEGALIYEERRNRTDFTIVIDGLPAGAYVVEIDGIFRGFLSSVNNRRGGNTAELVFSTRQRGERLLLNFEPRGKLVEVRSVLEDDRLFASGMLPMAVLAEENQDPEFDRTRVREELAVVDGSFASVQVDIKSNKRKAQANFKVRNLVPGIYELRGRTPEGDGEMSGPVGIMSFVAEGRGRGNFKFSTKPRGNQSMLAFDPTGTEYEIVRIDLDEELTVAVGNVGQAQTPGGDLMPLGDAVNELTSAGFDEDATATVTLDNESSQAEVTVELKGAPLGTYRIFIDDPGTGLFPLGSVKVSLDDPSEATESDEAGDQEDEIEDLLPDGVGPNEERETTGFVVFGTNRTTNDGQSLDQFGNRVESLPRLFPGSRFQGQRIFIIDSKDRTYFSGQFPDSTFPLPQFPTF